MNANTKYKPKFNAEDFMKGLEWFKTSTATDFLYFVKKRIENKHYDFSVIEEKFTNNKQVSNEIISSSLLAENGVVFMKSGSFVDKLSYAELLQILEYGRRDKEVAPQSVIRIAFEEYRPIYKERLQKFLKGKLK